MSNPNPALITDPMWRLWTDRPNQTWLLSGIYANKKGYHNTVIANQKNWPGNYSIRVPLDLVDINRDKARAIDLTMTPSEMIKWTSRMKASADSPLDKRLAAVREFYGTLDGKTIFGLEKDSEDGEWRHSTADLTHLWHGHTSIFTKYVNDWPLLSPILSVWAGESLSEWGIPAMLVKLGDQGEEVKYWQNVHNSVRTSVTPASPEIKVDGVYGTSTSVAFKDFVHKQGGQTGYDGNAVTYWLAMRYQRALTLGWTNVVTPPLSEEQLRELVTDWLSKNIPTDLVISGNITGKVTL